MDDIDAFARPRFESYFMLVIALISSIITMLWYFLTTFARRGSGCGSGLVF